MQKKPEQQAACVLAKRRRDRSKERRPTASGRELWRRDTSRFHVERIRQTMLAQTVQRRAAKCRVSTAISDSAGATGARPSISCSTPELRPLLAQLPAGFEPATWAIKVRSMAGLRHPAELENVLGQQAAKALLNSASTHFAIRRFEATERDSNPHSLQN